MRSCNIAYNLRDPIDVRGPVFELGYDARSSMSSDVVSICPGGTYGCRLEMRNCSISSPCGKNRVEMSYTCIPPIIFCGVKTTHAVSKSINMNLQFPEIYIRESRDIQTAKKNIQEGTKPVIDERDGGQVIISFRTIIKNSLREAPLKTTVF